MTTLLSWLAFFFHLLLCASGYYQQPEVVQFTSVPSDAVVCGGCRLEMSCSILRQNTTANLPQPRLEWIFNGRRLTEAFADIRIQTQNTLTHLSLALIIDNATANHSGTYQCRATDGSDSTHCSSIDCVPTTTISTPARIQIVDDTMRTEPVSIGSSCSEVAVLPCGSTMMQGTALETLNLNTIWRRNGQDFTPDSDSEVAMLSNGDLVMDATSTDEVGLYECIAVFNTDRYRNITVARYNVTSSESHTAGSGSGSARDSGLSIEDKADSNMRDYLRLISSGVVVLEGGSVEFVCEASVIMRGEEGGGGGHGLCVPYNVTWSVNSSSDGVLRPVAAAADSDTSSLALNNHLLRVSGVSSGSSQYCCQVHVPATASVGHRISQECTIIHVVPQHASTVNSSTVFLGSGGALDIAEISCSAAYGTGQHLYTWYYNGELIENYTSLSLTVNSQNVPDVFGVYQCFGAVQPYAVDVISITRVLPFGLTNPPGTSSYPEEVPYPVEVPHPLNPAFYAMYKVNWTAPVFTGGLSSLRYNIIIWPLFGSEYTKSSDTNSVVVAIEPNRPVLISVAVININPSIYSLDWRQHPYSDRLLTDHGLMSECWGQVVLHPPSPSLDCGHGLVTLSWQPNELNVRLIHNAGRTIIEDRYSDGYCTLTNGSIYQFNSGGSLTGPHTVSFSDEAVFEVGSWCQFTMASAKTCSESDGNCFCFDPLKIKYSEPAICVVQGYVEFTNATVQVHENETSVEVCIRASGYGFVVNMSTVELTATAGYNYAPIVNHQLHFSSLDQQHCLNITIMDNSVVEESAVHNFTIELSTDSDYVNVSDPATVEVIDNDYTAATVDFSQPSYNTSEGEGLLQVCASISVELEVNVSVNILSEDITAQGDSDYTDVNKILVFTPGGETTLCFDVFINDDRIYERLEMFSLSLNPLESAHIPLANSTVFVQILDNEVPKIQFSQSSYTISESQGWLEVCAEVDLELEVEISAIITSQNNTANTGDDYIPVNEILIFVPGRESVECFNVSINDDNIFETSESFTLSLGVEHDNVPENATVYILDDEYVRVYFDQSSYTVAEGEGELEVCVAIDKELGVPVHVNLFSQDSTAKGDSDYGIVQEVLTFTPEEDSMPCLNISIINDDSFENSETFTLTLTVRGDYNSRVVMAESASVTILDNDEQMTDNLNAVASGVSMGVVFFLLVLVVAGSISFLVMALLRRQRRGDWSVKQHYEIKVEDFDIDFEPPIIIGADATSLSESKKVCEDNFDSQTLLNYLLTRSPSSTDLNTTAVTVPVHQIQPLNQDYPHHTDLNSSTNPLGEHHVIKSGVHPPVNGYNLSVESGVVMDADHEVFGRKISDGSNNLSQGSHSYIAITGKTTITCSCSECKVHREGIHSLQTYNKESSTVEIRT